MPFLAIGVWLVNDPEPVFMFYAVITSGLFWWGLRDVPLWTGVFLLMQPIWQVMWRTQWIHTRNKSYPSCLAIMAYRTNHKVDRCLGNVDCLASSISIDLGKSLMVVGLF